MIAGILFVNILCIPKLRSLHFLLLHNRRSFFNIILHDPDFVCIWFPIRCYILLNQLTFSLSCKQFRFVESYSCARMEESVWTILSAFAHQTILVLSVKLESVRIYELVLMCGMML